MTGLLHRLYLLTQRHSWLYPVYLTLRLPVVFPALVGNEGLRGAIVWLRRRVAFLLENRRKYGSREFYRQAIPPFKSRLGFELTHPVDYIIYDEIFLTRCYAFAGFSETVRGADLVVDFGAHHGMFMEYVRTLNPTVELYGAEMNPESYSIARRRFAGVPKAHLSNLAIGGTNRTETIGLVFMSIEQSLYADPEGRETREVEVVTPAEFVQRCNLGERTIGLLKIDIEGAEREVFEHFECIKGVLQHTRSIVMEIHSEQDVDTITKELGSCGFRLDERRGINFFYRRNYREIANPKEPAPLCDNLNG